MEVKVPDDARRGGQRESIIAGPQIQKTNLLTKLRSYDSSLTIALHFTGFSIELASMVLLFPEFRFLFDSLRMRTAECIKILRKQEERSFYVLHIWN